MMKRMIKGTYRQFSVLWPRRVALTLVLSSGFFVVSANGATSNAADTDGLFANIQQLSPTQLVEAVLKRNADIPAMQATWQAAQARIEQAGALDDPKLSYQAAPQTLGQNTMDFGQKLSISQRLPWSGKRGLRADVARFEADASREGIARARLRLTEATERSYADWYFVHAALRINHINRSLLLEFQNIAEIKYAAGRTSKQDVLRAEVEATLLEHRNIVLQRQRREVLSRINTLLQRLPDAPLPQPGNLVGLNTLPSIVVLRQQALKNHPELRALQARIMASRRRLTLSERDFYPDVTVSAGYNSLWNQDEKRLTAGASINIPLRGKRNAASDETRARTLRLAADQKTKVAKILDAVQRAYEQVRESEHVLTLYGDRLLPLAEENLAAAQSDYESGSGGFLDLISAEKNRMQTQLQLAQAKADYHRRLATLKHTIGGPLMLQERNTGSNP